MTISHCIVSAEPLNWSIFIGDHMQLGLFGHTIGLSGENPFRHQMRSFGFERRKLLHVPLARVPHQHRMTEGLEWYSRGQFYEGLLENTVGTELSHESRRLTRTIACQAYPRYSERGCGQF